MTLDPRLAKHYHAALPDHVRGYLNARGIPDPVIARTELGWTGQRIAIPVYDRDDKLVLFKLGKAPDDTTDSPKMLYYPPGVRAELYGWDTLKRTPRLVIICEGEYDRLILEALGFPAVTGTSGAGVFTEEWALALGVIPAVYICFDNDEVGRKGAERVARIIPHSKIVTLPPEVGESGDISDYFIRFKKTPADFRLLLDRAMPPPPITAAPLSTTPRSAPVSHRSATARLKASVHIEDVLAQYLPLRPSGRTFMGLCCFHEDHAPSLAVFPDTQSFYCFGCGTHGDVITFLMAVEHLNFVEAVAVLRRLGHSR